MSAADIAVAGMDVSRYLKLKDPHERLIMSAVAQEVIERHKVRDHNLAVKIVNGVGKLVSK
jgi:hypothetical protein